jgi:hypothetical protein
MASAFLDDLNQRYFSGALSPGALELMRGVERESKEVRAFVDRLCRLMRLARVEARDFSLLLAWEIGAILPRILPGAWGGIVPPITLAGRHIRIDEYVRCTPWARFAPGATLVDIGCGFPPLTTVDSATRLSGWNVIGSDPGFGRYLAYDARGDR